MNLRRVQNYSIGLDLGTNSVGWAVVDEDTGKLLTYSGDPTWGSRLFDEGKPAAERRMKRGMRRRYDRRRWRITLLQNIFALPISEIDETFFLRLKQSQLVGSDKDEALRDVRPILFHDEDYTDTQYYREFPAIYHLRARLVSDPSKADLRLIYLAIHHIVKYRGNFLFEDVGGLSSENADLTSSVEELVDEFEHYVEMRQWEPYAFSVDTIRENLSQNEKRGLIKDGLKNLIDTNDKSLKKAWECIVDAILGYKAKFQNLFEFDDNEKHELYLSDDEEVLSLLESLSSDEANLLNAMRMVYSSITLQNLLSLVPGKSLSFNKIAEYEKFKKELKGAKEIIVAIDERDNSNLYREQFCNADVSNSFAAYMARKCTQQDFIKGFKKVLNDGKLVTDDCKAIYEDIFEKQDDENVLKRLRTSDNGAIPYQLHLEELERILENQSVYYPFLNSEREHILSLVRFRIPYYVGPLNPHSKFAWIEKNPGREHDRIYPWNIDEIVDKEKTASAFIANLTGKCTYLLDEDVLPRHSLLYEEYCVLNELNTVVWTKDGFNKSRLSSDIRQGIMKDLFERKLSVSKKDVEEWLKKQGYPNTSVEINKSDPIRFTSQLSSYVKFSKILDVDELNAAQRDMVEDLALWCTVFEDRKILRHTIRKHYGDLLSDEQINKISKMRFTGWGRLSKRFLVGLFTETDEGPRSIMDILRDGRPNNSGKSRPQNLMEILRDDEYGFQELIQNHNEGLGRLKLDELPCSPAIRRAINQALKVVEEIVSIAGHDPKKINIEVARSVGDKKKQTTNRYKQVENALKVIKDENSRELLEELSGLSNKDLNERYMLYFMQMGKSAYSGKPLRIDSLKDYHVDHIIPRCYVKNDGLSNKVLCLREENERKLDTLLLDKKIINKMYATWKAWRDNGLISKEKFDNLTRTSLSDRQLSRFISRQLVETSQIMKLTGEMLGQCYPDTRIVPIKAALSSDIRQGRYASAHEDWTLPKSRSLNDFHHAHDAYLACTVSRYLDIRFSDLMGNPIRMAEAAKLYIDDFMQREQMKHPDNPEKRKKIPTALFLVDGFGGKVIDDETGEIYWNGEEEIGYMKKVLAYRTCHVTRRMEETTGAFWDETIYPANSTKTLVPLKFHADQSGDSCLRPANVYGGKSSVKAASYFIWIGEKGKRARKVVQFQPYPRYVKAQGVSEDDYMDMIAQEIGLDNPYILVPRVCLGQKIQVGSDRFMIKKQDAVANAKPLVLSPEEILVVGRMEKVLAQKNVDWPSEDELESLYLRLSEKIPEICGKMTVLINAMESSFERFRSLSSLDQMRLLDNILAYVNGKNLRVDLKMVGGSSNAGGLSIQGLMNECLKGDLSELYFIDESVTGLHTRRRHIGI